MKLDTKKNILLYQKSLYTEQLYYYSKLCKLYSNLASIHSTLTTAEDIAKFYSTPLSLASKGKYDFIIKNDYSKEELDIFKKYEFFSQRFNEFKKASEVLSEVINNEF